MVFKKLFKKYILFFRIQLCEINVVREMGVNRILIKKFVMVKFIINILVFVCIFLCFYIIVMIMKFFLMVKIMEMISYVVKIIVFIKVQLVCM